MDFSSAADELYGVAPDEFVAARTRLARQAKDEGDAALARRLGALRRPTLPAWAVNLLARSAAGDLGRLLDVGEEIRSAWGSGGLGDLERRRARLVQDLVRAAGDLASAAGHPLRDQAVREVEDTLQAATVDARVADEVREGRLAQPRSHSGFVPAGFPMAPDGAGEEERAAPRRKRPKEKPPKKDDAAEPAQPKPAQAKPARAGGQGAARARRAETLRRRADEAEAALDGHREKAEEAREAAESAADAVGRLRHGLERAVADRDAAARRAERAERALARAQDAAREARRAASDAERAAERAAERG